MKSDIEETEGWAEHLVQDACLKTLSRLSLMFSGRFSSPVDAGDGDWFMTSQAVGSDKRCEVRVSLYLGELVVGMGPFMHTHFEPSSLESARALIRKLLNGEVGALVAYSEEGSWSWCTGIEDAEGLTSSVKRLGQGEHLELHFYWGQQMSLFQ